MQQLGHWLALQSCSLQVFFVNVDSLYRLSWRDVCLFATGEMWLSYDRPTRGVKGADSEKETSEQSDEAPCRWHIACVALLNELFG